MAASLRIVINSSVLLICCVFVSDAWHFPWSFHKYFHHQHTHSHACKHSAESVTCEHFDSEGACGKISNCLLDLGAWERQSFHDLKRCGFNGTLEVVCCLLLPTLIAQEFESTTLNPVSSVRTPPVVMEATGPAITSDLNKPEPEIGTKRKSEQMCDQFHTDYNIQPPLTRFVNNGVDATKGQYPHAAALGIVNSDEKFIWTACGASLISSRFLLTAAHCVWCLGCNAKKVKLGVVDINEKGQEIDIKNYTLHPGYDRATRRNDIAIVELVQNVEMSRIVYPACLYTKLDDPVGLRVIGWGQTVFNDSASVSPVLQGAIVDPIPITECNATMLAKRKQDRITIENTQICAKSKSDACQGDSGNGLQIPTRTGSYELVGVVNYGTACGSTDPGIYTRVARYLDWIEATVWPDES